MKSIAIVGLGYWGVNFARIINNSTLTSLEMVVDISPENLKEVKERYPNVTTTTNIEELVSDKSIDTVVVVTPTTTHYKVARKLLENKKNVLCEKPLCTNQQEAAELYKIARENDVVLMTGFTFLFNSAVEYVKNKIENSDLGDIRYINFVRTGLGPIRSDVNVLWDLGPHDVSMLLYWLNAKPISVIAVGSDYIQTGVEDVVFLTIELENKILVKLHLSWLDPIKTRKVTVVGSKKMLVFDDVDMHNKIQIYDKGVSYLSKTGNYEDFQISIRDGEVHLPNLKLSEPLRAEFDAFIKMIDDDQKWTDDNISIEVVKILESAQKSLSLNGKKISLYKC